ncbi:MAG: peptidase prolyl oligopeptidase active site region [Candidatus Taylorbacteria bacterium]|nr:peptidase prolyl oligopeptidase active site region [Candidatus Taylorbacteria bacterium]
MYDANTRLMLQLENMTHDTIIDSFLKTPCLYEAKVSPDLKWAVWVWANVGPNADVYIAPLDARAAPRKLTDFGQDTSIMSWTEDSRSIIVHHDYDGDERYRLYRVDIDSGEAFPLTEEHPSCFIRGGQMTADGKYVVYGANYDFDAKKEIEPTILYRHDLQTGERVKLAQPKKPAFLWPLLNAQGTRIIYQRNDRHPQGEQIWMADIEGKEDKEILNFGDKVKVSASWHPNGEDVIFISEAGTYRKVGIFHAADSSIRWIIDDAARNIEEAYVPRGSERLVIDEIRNAQNFISLIDIGSSTEAAFAELQTAIPVAQMPDGTWISKYYHSKQPRDLVMHSTSAIIRSITDVFGRVKYGPADLAKAENYVWNSIDGLKIQGWLYRPAAKSIGTVVCIHGGPTAHSEDEWNMDIQYFVSQGFNVLDPNYRGSSGFGLPYQDAIKESGWGGKEQDDIIEGIKSLIQDGIAEEGKVGVTGTSYGGYSSWFAITHFPKKYIAAAIPICGMTDLVVDYDTTRPDLRGYSEEMMGGSPKEVPERYHDGSPIHFIQNIEGKLLIVQGAKDPNVSLENVRAVEEVLHQKGIRYEKLIFEDEGHGISKPENQKTLLLRSVEFFKEAFSS